MWLFHKPYLFVDLKRKKKQTENMLYLDIYYRDMKLPIS